MQQTKVQTKELNLIWSVPSSDVLHAFMQELSSWEYSSDLVLNFDVHITREVADVEPGLLSDVIKIHHGRPDYGLVLETIRQRNSRTHVALGLCAADETVQKCGNQVRGATFSNEQSWWSICAERFEL
ncbi:hypothetical protein PHYBLDRAFT_157018 [Phycomyces blakesleeanus NRRL 1555(-)]|uniref:Uncharacterized protein n=2 Tax=Phycomyces blakesleeanus TaxID=4837 RepID=A0A167R621_PHYB8|nr:hypothetical protein PHYBLDRAFT_157018 [Phycomyces blakesleeanus NRRL 1555(-)]OAD80934.1 hypothetical protein PHYBLDRAFT_157018 [Phycomyces blakesleeanus NRRL 1555(-)]|eukprot:XP_018298974.1 hypothetical protein PHYBLDRAFT_157018 [Phycomyces blakesleeanus NRRL 1555(-)]